MPAPGRLEGIFGRRRFDIKPGLTRISSLLNRMGSPERKFRSIHVVGTNGKGSTATFISSILTAAGYRTGLFTSPHLIDYAERFRVNGAMIDGAALDSLLSELLPMASDDDTFFELTTAIACCYFACSEVDIAVLEAGMGGRSDATAAINAIATVITPVSMDHVRWLGETVAKIAAEKVAIAEKATPIISSVQGPDALTVIEEYSSLHANHLLLAGRDFNAFNDSDAGSFSFEMGHNRQYGLQSGIPGAYQLWNAATAIAACRALAEHGITVSESAIEKGLSSASWPGRMQRFSTDNGIDILVDGAHNPAGAQALADSIIREAPPERVILLVGLMEDKDIAGTLEILKGLANRIVTVAPAQERAADPASVAEHCKGSGRSVHVAGNVANGLNLARRIASSGDLILVAGSLFVAGEVIAILSGSGCDAVRC